MNTYKISIPNDYESEADSEAAMQDCYREEIEAAVVRLEARAYSDPANADCCMLPLDEECDGKALLKALESRWKAGLPAAFSSDEVIAEGRDGLDQAAANDEGRALYDVLAEAAEAAGLKYQSETDYGALWTGTEAQFASCVDRLPGWAKRYASKVDE